MRVGAAVERDDCVPRKRLAECSDRHLRANRRALGADNPTDQRIPVTHARLCGREEAAILLVLQHRHQSGETRLDVADEPDLDGVAQADPLRVDVDLHAACLPRLRIVVDPGHGRAQDQDGVAFLHRLLRRQGAEMTDATRRVGTVVGKHRLAQQRLRHRSTQPLRQRGDLLARFKCALSDKDGDTRAGVQQIGCCTQLVLRRNGPLRQPRR